MHFTGYLVLAFGAVMVLVAAVSIVHLVRGAFGGGGDRQRDEDLERRWRE